MPAINKAAKAGDENMIEKHKWLIGLLFGGLFNTGIMYQQFQQVQKTLEEQRLTQANVTAKLSEIREKQVAGLQDVEVLKSNVKNIDSRVLVIERIFIERPQVLPVNRDKK